MDQSKILDRFVNNLKRLMNQHHYSQASLARDLEVTRAVVNRWLGGKNMPNAATLSLFCSTFKVDVIEFFKPCPPTELSPNGRKK